MRRLLATVSLLLSVVAVPSSAAPSAGTGAVYHVPGRMPIGAAATDAQWLEQQYEAVAGTPMAEEVLRRYDVAVAAGEGEITALLSGGDLDGDRVEDLLVYRSEFTMEKYGPEGWVDLTALSGRTGKKRWHRHFEDFAFAFPMPVRVGADGRTGLMLARPFRHSDTETSYRIVGLGGARGETAYDRRISSTDGRGEIQWGGLFDAFSRGGTDVLIGRVTKVLPVSPSGVKVLDAIPYVLDGRDGKVRAVHERTFEVGQAVAFVATGDLDGDRRDDFVSVRRELAGRGVVTAYSTVENKTLWATKDVPVGWYVGLGGVADMAGDAREDFVLESWTMEDGLLEIAGVTDGIPLLAGPPKGIHGLLFEGGSGALRWDRLDGELGFYVPWADLNGDRKVDVVVAALVTGARDGLRIVAVTGADKVLYRRDITVKPPVGRSGVGAATGSAGDLDGDRIRDLSYFVVSGSKLQEVHTQGLLLVRTNKAVTTDDFALGGTLDGRTDERYSYSVKGSRTTMVVRDGWRGPEQWRLTATAKNAGFALGALDGGRGRCDDVLLFGYSRDALWFDVLDGGTGRVRWSTTVEGKRVPTKLDWSGRRVRCG